jgi:hypothetical protein
VEILLCVVALGAMLSGAFFIFLAIDDVYAPDYLFNKRIFIGLSIEALGCISGVITLLL